MGTTAEVDVSFVALCPRVSSPPVRGVELLRRPLTSRLAPEEALLWLRGDKRPFALVGDWFGGTAVLGSEPLRIADPGGDPFSLLESPAVVDGGEAAVGGGWVGWLGYGLGGRIERLRPSPPAPAPRPSCALAFYDHVVLFDGEQWWFEALRTPERAAALRERREVWERRLRTVPPPAGDVVLTPFALAANGAAGHVAAVRDCRRRIASGELFQANLCVRLQASVKGDVLDLFARGLPRARPRFGALVEGVVSLSPERFVRRVGRSVQTEPIKGTRTRAGSKHERDEERAALVASSKDAAEHVMIVDLMRNDLGRVCQFGTIVAEPPRVEAHAGVWHLVSTVSGRLREDVGDGALLRATFPPGSVTGAPKVQAMKVIAELEATRRELYTGAIGIISPVAGVDLSVAIRTFETRGETIWFGAGGGIVADSDPELELAEALAKAAGPIAAIGGRLLRPPSRRARAARVPERALAHGPRPDPAHGVFETVLVEPGAPVCLREHLERLRSSLRELYGVGLDPHVETTARAAAARAAGGRSRLRVLADPGGQVSVTVTRAGPPPNQPVRLTPYALPGGLGGHKWRDRQLLDALAALNPGTVPLLVDTDGQVLEAAYASVWIAEGDALITPPADGRILPAITRLRLLGDHPAAREEAFDLSRLERADAIFLTSSIAGRHAAGLTPNRSSPLAAPRRQ